MFGLPQASTLSQNIDALYRFIFWASFVSFAIIVIGIIIFVLRYRKRSAESDKKTPYITGHLPTEMSVASVLLILVMAIFLWGWIDYRKILRSPDDALEINVVGRQWLWNVWYTNGRQLTNELVVPKDRPVKLLMSSEDVIHSFFIPNFRLKQDVLPGSYTTLWFQATETGEHQVFCAEYCGAAHSQMLAKVKVLEPAEFEAWQAAWKPAVDGKPKVGANLLDVGQELFVKRGCNACHTVTESKLIGPGMKAVFGRTTELADGTKVKVDENYIRESLMDPQAKLVKGFPPVMPTFRGTLTDDEVNALVIYLKSLK